MSKKSETGAKHTNSEENRRFRRTKHGARRKDAVCAAFRPPDRRNAKESKKASARSAKPLKFTANLLCVSMCTNKHF